MHVINVCLPQAVIDKTTNFPNVPNSTTSPSQPIMADSDALLTDLCSIWYVMVYILPTSSSNLTSNPPTAMLNPRNTDALAAQRALALFPVHDVTNSGRNVPVYVIQLPI